MEGSCNLQLLYDTAGGKIAQEKEDKGELKANEKKPDGKLEAKRQRLINFEDKKRIPRENMPLLNKRRRRIS